MLALAHHSIDISFHRGQEIFVSQIYEVPVMSGIAPEEARAERRRRAAAVRAAILNPGTVKLRRLQLSSVEENRECDVSEDTEESEDENEVFFGTVRRIEAAKIFKTR